MTQEPRGHSCVRQFEATRLLEAVCHVEAPTVRLLERPVLKVPVEVLGACACMRAWLAHHLRLCTSLQNGIGVGAELRQQYRLTFAFSPGVYGDKVYLVTELLDGGELLDTVITRGSYTERDARAIFKSVRFSGVCAPPTTARCPVRQSDATESVCSALMLQLARVVGVMAACSPSRALPPPLAGLRGALLPALGRQADCPPRPKGAHDRPACP